MNYGIQKMQPEKWAAPPSIDEWLKEAKSTAGCTVYLLHNSTVRAADSEGKPMKGIFFDYDKRLLSRTVEESRQIPGISFIKVWLNVGHLKTGEDIMYVMVCGDRRPIVMQTLQELVGRIKGDVITVREEY